MTLTQNLLRKNSTRQSFERGENYHDDGSVETLVKRGEVYEGVVWGSKKYRQTIDLRSNKLVATCSCPYNYTGFCKHIIAVGLAVIAEEFTETKADFVEKKEETASFESIDQIREAIRRDTQKVTFTPQPPSIGFEDDPQYGEEMMGMSRKVLFAIFDPCGERMKVYLKKGQVFDAFKLLLGMYEGHVNQPGPAYVGYHTLFDFQELVWSIMEPYIDHFATEIGAMDLSFRAKGSLIKLLLKRWRHFEDKYQKEEDAILYEITDFEALFLKLLSDGVTAHFLRTRLSGYSLNNEEFRSVFDRIAEFD